MLRLVCEENMSIKQVVESEKIRRLLSKSYPTEPKPPKSRSTLRKYLSEDAEQVRDDLWRRFEGLLPEGLKVSLSFDEATFTGSDRYLSINVHHSSVIFGKSKVAPLGFVRLRQRATAEHLRDLVCSRLRSFNLLPADIVAASTDGASNVVKAVDLLGFRKQKCFAHGLDLVVRKIVCGGLDARFDETNATLVF